MPTLKAVRVTLALAIAVSVALVATSVAYAAPAEPTLGLAALHDKLDASPDGSLSGYMKTVVKGSKISTIPVTVLAITGDAQPSSSLILFEASGSLIDKYGGIVAGMSGSPIYVTDDGQDKLVGAVSYGDVFTLGGTGLATPIEAMQQLEDTYAPGVQPLDRPVMTAEGVYDRVIVSSDPQSFKGASAQGALVAEPLSGLFIGGISPESRPYKRLAAALASRGINVVELAAPLSASPASGDESLSTTLTAGSSVAALASTGDFWFGDVGTVTYATTDSVLAFGHSVNDDGPSDLLMSNADVTGIWPSIYRPYKIARPTAERGTFVQDRSAGTLGVIGQMPAETTITAEATNVDTQETTTSVAYVPRRLLDSLVFSGDYYGEIPGAAASIAGMNLFDQYNTPGSATVTTTVVFRDTDADKLYTAVIPAFIDDAYDIPSSLTGDVDSAVSELQATMSYDGFHFEILTIDVQSRISRHRRFATVVSATVPGGVHTGANVAHVSLLVNGVQATQTVDVPFTVPRGMPTNGSLLADNAESTADDLNSSGSAPTLLELLQQEYSQDTSAGPRYTIADIADDLNSYVVQNNVLALSYVASTIDNSSDGSDYSGASLASVSRIPQSITATVTTPWVLDGKASGYSTTLTAKLAHATTAYNSANSIAGIVTGTGEARTISLYATPADTGVASLVATTSSNPDTGAFAFRTRRLTTNTTFDIHVDSALDVYSSADAVLHAKVAAKAWLSSSASSAPSGHKVSFTVAVWPAANAGSKVTFEFYVNGRWRAIATKQLETGSSARCSVTWKVRAGSTKVRAHFLGSRFNVQTFSGPRTVKGT